MRPRAEIEKQMNDDDPLKAMSVLRFVAVELLLDLRDQNERIVTLLQSQNEIVAASVENERDTLLRTAGLQT